MSASASALTAMAMALLKLRGSMGEDYARMRAIYCEEPFRLHRGESLPSLCGKLATKARELLSEAEAKLVLEDDFSPAEWKCAFVAVDLVPEGVFLSTSANDPEHRAALEARLEAIPFGPSVERGGTSR